jgi:hypothetical protein
VQDQVEAYKWMNLASVRSSGSSQIQYIAARDQLAKQMTPAQAEEGQKRTREWLEAFATTQK